jgi:2-iminobutanoate/2-iminopropanoate deaminase
VLKTQVNGHCERSPEGASEAISILELVQKGEIASSRQTPSGFAMTIRRLFQQRDRRITLSGAEMKHIPLVLAGLSLLLGCGRNDDDIRRIVREELSAAMQKKIVKAVDVVGPYSPAVRVGNFLFVSGQIGLDQETGQLKNETIETETRQALDNLMRILRAENFDSSDVVSATVYLKNMNDYAKMNLIYGGYFPEESYPARVAVEVSNLPRQGNVEIAMVAYKAR